MNLRAIEIADFTNFGDMNGCSTWVIGKGALSAGGNLAQQLMELQTKSYTRNHPNCQYEQIQDSAFCTYSEDEDACQGDSGGPVFIDMDLSTTSHHYVLTGLVSWGYSCAVIGGVNTNVGYYKDWIQQRAPEVRFYSVMQNQCDTAFYEEGGAHGNQNSTDPDNTDPEIGEGECLDWEFGVPNYSNQQTEQDDRNLIVNGGEALTHEYPWYVWIGWCGGVIVSEKTVLTAAHCEGLSPTVTVENSVHETIGTGTMQCHGSYSGSTITTLGNDICIIHMHDDIPCDDVNLRPIEIAEFNNFDDMNECSTWVIGKGTLSAGGNLAQQLMELQTKSYTRNHGSCQYNQIQDSAFCTYSEDEDACQGDSGGPVFIDVDPSTTSHHYVLTGLVSWGYSCAQIGGVNTNVAYYKDWIQQRAPEVRFYSVSQGQCDTSFYEEGGATVPSTPSSPSTLPSTITSPSPSGSPSLPLSLLPSAFPLTSPSSSPSTDPSVSPSVSPTTSTPTRSPSSTPSNSPSTPPSSFPSFVPSSIPSTSPIASPQHQFHRSLHLRLL
jgi:secreted trypsin-like serine protease